MSSDSGFCVYFFSHGGGAGRYITETKNMKLTKMRLKGPDVSNIVCDVDKKMAIRKYNNLMKKKKNNKSTKSKRSTKSNKLTQSKRSTKSNKLTQSKKSKKNNNKK